MPYYENYDLEPTMLPPEKETYFNSYIEEFNLDVDQLKDKRILDVGSGTNPIFVTQCLEKGITKYIYGIDQEAFFSEWEDYLDEGKRRYPKEEVLKSEIKKHYIQARAENLPFKPGSFDLILMRAVIRPETDLGKVFERVGIVLAQNGEFKIFPVFRESNERQRLDKVLQELDSNQFEFEWKEINSYEAGGKKYYRDLLTIRKK